MKQRQHEIALSKAIFAVRLSATRSQREPEYSGNKSTNQTKVPFVRLKESEA